MFQNSLFNKTLSSWDVSSATALLSMFGSNTSFNQDISMWNISNVIAAAGMFYEATAFNKSLAAWNVTSLTGAQSLFFANGSGLSTTNYNSLLISWASQNVKTGVSINFGISQYTAGSDAATARATLVSKGWTITDGGTA